MQFKAILSLAVLSALATAEICPGANYALFDVSGTTYVSDDSCTVVSSSTNPCAESTLFHCTDNGPADIDRINVDGLWYDCTPTSEGGNSDKCGAGASGVAGATPAKCCSNTQ